MQGHLPHPAEQFARPVEKSKKKSADKLKRPTRFTQSIFSIENANVAMNEDILPFKEKNIKKVHTGLAD